MVREYIVIGFTVALGWCSTPGWWAWTAAEIPHSHRNTSRQHSNRFAKRATDSRDVKVLVPAEGMSTSCAPPCVIVPELQENQEAEFYAEIGCDDKPFYFPRSRTT